MFISQAYVKKAWTRHEIRPALSRMIQNQSEYILPVRFDDTPLLGLPEDVIFLRANQLTPAQLSAIIANKLGISHYDGKASEVPPPRMTSPVGKVVLSTVAMMVVSLSVLECWNLKQCEPKLVIPAFMCPMTAHQSIVLH